MQEHSEASETPADPDSWVLANHEVRQTNSTEFLYEHMESQSGRQLTDVYVPFNAADDGHFRGIARSLDYALHTNGGRVLDFGPGDGWPSLALAPYVKEIVGVDGAQRRVEVCEQNARRMGIGNARFLRVEPGKPLPFSAGSFDAVVAASSIEQTPDPKATLAELHRVLKPGGVLRMDYEPLGYYRGGREHEVWLAGMSNHETRLVLFDRHIDEEYARHVGLVLPMSKADVKAVFARHGVAVSYAAMTEPLLRDLVGRTVEAGTWRTQHPSCRTWLTWLREVGFSCAKATYDGHSFARVLVERIPRDQRPKDREAIEEYLRPIVQTMIELEAPPPARPDGWEPMITARK